MEPTKENPNEPVLRLATEPKPPAPSDAGQPEPPSPFGMGTGLRLVRPVEPVGGPTAPGAGSAPAPAPEPANVSSLPKGASATAEPGSIPCARCRTVWSRSLLIEVSNQHFCPACADLQKLDEASVGKYDGLRKACVVVMGVLAALAIVAIVWQSGILKIIFGNFFGHLPELAGIVATVAGFTWLVVEAFENSGWWGIYCLFSPGLNILLMAAFGGPRAVLTGRDPLFSTMVLLMPTALIIYVLNHWHIARKPFATYLAGVLFLAGGFIGGPDGRTLAIGQWIADDNSAAIELTVKGDLVSLTSNASGRYRFNSGETFYVDDLPVFSSGRFDKASDRLSLKFWVSDDKGKALYTLGFDRLTSKNRDRLGRMPGKKRL